MSRDARLYLDDIAESLAKVGRYIAGCNQQLFLNDELRVSGVERELFVAGEAAKHIASSVRVLAPDVDWRGIAGFRDVLGHDYFGIDPETLWEIASIHAPKALTAIAALLDKLDRSR